MYFQLLKGNKIEMPFFFFFIQTFVSIFIKEDDAPSTFLKLFRAHDIDEKKTRNSRIKYHLSGNNSNMFSMGLHTGKLLIN